MLGLGSRFDSGVKLSIISVQVWKKLENKDISLYFSVHLSGSNKTSFQVWWVGFKEIDNLQPWQLTLSTPELQSVLTECLTLERFLQTVAKAVRHACSLVLFLTLELPLASVSGVLLNLDVEMDVRTEKVGRIPVFNWGFSKYGERYPASLEAVLIDFLGLLRAAE